MREKTKCSAHFVQIEQVFFSKWDLYTKVRVSKLMRFLLLTYKCMKRTRLQKVIPQSHLQQMVIQTLMTLDKNRIGNLIRSAHAIRKKTAPFTQFEWKGLYILTKYVFFPTPVQKLAKLASRIFCVWRWLVTSRCSLLLYTF